MTTGRITGLLAAVCLTACGAGGPGPTTTISASSHETALPVRLFHGGGEPDFWVLHEAERDLVIASGARLELDPQGAITAAAWDLTLARRGDAILGALAVPARLGGGFVHWTRAHVLRSQTFTGPLEPVAFDVEGAAIRGARVGLSSILVFTDAGPRELLPGASQLRAFREPGIRDAAAISDRRAARIDVFGRALATDDGGRTFTDLSPMIGLAGRHLAVSADELFVDTWDVRAPIHAGGKVDLGEHAGRPNHDAARIFSVAWKALRGSSREELPWSSGPTTPLGAAIATGGAVGDGTAFGVVQGAAARVDLRTGKLLAVAGEWLPSSLSCQPVRAPDALLFACAWERFQGYGGYVLRSVAGAPPVIERAFSDDGTFVADDEGALGFVGSCRAEPRFFDPEEQSKQMESGVEPPIAPVLCVRRGPGEWVERRVDLAEGSSIVAWVAGKDGRAAAITTTLDPLPPPPSPAGRGLDRGGARLVQIDREIDGWSVVRMGSESYRGGTASIVDRRFRMRDDGSIDAWLSSAQDSYAPVAVGANIDPRGAVTIHAAAPRMIAIATGGSFGLSLSNDGELYESTDHGRSYRLAGRSPVPAPAFGQASCSALGCVLGSVVRVGWGDGAVAPSVRIEPLRVPDRPPPHHRLSCRPSGAPIPLAAPPPVPSGSRTTIGTGWGDTLDIVRDANAPEPTASSSVPAVPVPVAPAPSAQALARPAKPPAPAPKKPPRASPAVLRTHTLILRTPFAPRAPVRRLEATDASYTARQRSQVTPLLGPRGDVELLVAGDHGELLVAGDRIQLLPAADGRRWSRGDGVGPAGLVTAAGRALTLGDTRRRLTLEERGPTAPSANIALGVELDEPRRRPLTLGRRDDGTIGVLVLDGPAPETVGAATIDRIAAVASLVTPLAPWSTLVGADDPRCDPRADATAFRALLMIDPSAWLRVDLASLPGVALSKQGMIQVRWGRDRVCLEAIDASIIDQRTRGATPRSFSLVARWGGEGERGAALRTGDLRQDLNCKIDATK
ncbi:Hypothetical protein A7982_01145 [Minicystis rosea]|nr:Hypothetical protein A7982_01145 [Minicystis rosea]